MTYLPFGPPYPVSPLIRGARFAFLFAGIIYGQIKQKRYAAQEKIWREEEAKRKIIRDRENAILRARIAREEKETTKLLESGKLFDPPEEESQKTEKPRQKKKPCEEDE